MNLIAVFLVFAPPGGPEMQLESSCTENAKRRKEALSEGPLGVIL